MNFLRVLKTKFHSLTGGGSPGSQLDYVQLRNVWNIFGLTYNKLFIENCAKTFFGIIKLYFENKPGILTKKVVGERL